MLDSNPPSYTPAAAPMTSPPISHAARPSMSAAPMPSFTSMGSGILSPTMSSMSSATKPSTPAMSPQPMSKPASTAGAFDDLWSMSLGSSAAPKPAASNAAGTGKKSMLDLQREKAQAGIWGQTGSANTGFGVGGGVGESSGAGKSAGGGMDDLLL